MRAWILGILLVIVGLVLAVGLWLLGYHLTGKWAFNHWKAERVAMGDRLDWKDLVPPPVPAEQNFAEAPLIRGAILGQGKVDPRFQALAIPKGAAEAMGAWQEGRKDDLEAIARSYGTKDLQTAFRPLEGVFEELDQASRRSACRLPIDYREWGIPALLGFRGVVRTLRIRALANLRAGHPDQALEDLRTCFRITNHLKVEPNLISSLLRSAILNIAMQVVWEGTEEHLWKVSHLAVIQDDLSKIDLLQTEIAGWQGERQGFITLQIAMAEHQPLPKFITQGISQSLDRVGFGALGRGWVYRNLLEYSKFLTHLMDVQDAAARRVFPSRYIESEAWVARYRFRPDLPMARIAVPALGGQVIRFAKLQALLDEGVVVCALERHRLDKGQYPDRLEALTPAYLQVLPHDLVTGGPLLYAHQGDTFKLYQVGWNGKDDGGTVGWAGEGKDRRLDPAKGDWAWPHASRGAGLP
jgi:hypothetical protein